MRKKKHPSVVRYNWLSKGPPDLEGSIRTLVDGIYPTLEENGFSWAKHHPCDGHPYRPEISVFHRSTKHEIEYVQLKVDHYRRRRFHISFGVFSCSSEQRLLKSGKLTRRGGDETDGYAWWGARPWSVLRARALRRDVRVVIGLFPQVMDSVNDKGDGPNIYVWRKGDPEG